MVPPCFCPFTIVPPRLCPDTFVPETFVPRHDCFYTIVPIHDCDHIRLYPKTIIVLLTLCPTTVPKNKYTHTMGILSIYSKTHNVHSSYANSLFVLVF